jgi:hypothetical protein
VVITIRWRPLVIIACCHLKPIIMVVLIHSTIIEVDFCLPNSVVVKLE